MAGIALTQLVRRGCPVVLGSFHSTMNLRTGSLTFGTPEANLVTLALSQLGRRPGLPVRSGDGQVTAANAPDAQAMADGVNAMWATVLSGANQVWHAAGWLEGGPGDNFLSTRHTMRHFAEANYESLLPDAGPFETWSENGSQSAAEHAGSVWKRMLKDYAPPELDAGIQAELDEFVAARKAKMPDEWY